MTDFTQSERQGLAKMQAAESAHPDADLLTAFAEQSLVPREREQVLAHLAVCEDCREVVGCASPEVVAESVPQVVPKPAFWRWPVLRWGAVAASAVIIVGAVTVEMRERAPKNQMAGYVQPKVQEGAPAPATESPVVEGEPAQSARSANESARIVEPAKSKGVISEYKASPAVSGLKSAQVRYEKLPEDQKTMAKLEADKLVMAASPRRDEMGRAAMGNAVRENRPAVVAGVPELHGSATEFNVKASAGAAVGGLQQRQGALADTASASKPVADQDASTAMNYTKAAPAPPPGAPAESRSETVTVQSSAETVEVQSAIQPQASSIPAMAMKKQVKERQKMATDVQATAFAKSDAGNEWMISSDGRLQRSAGQGNWQPVLSDSKFKALAVVENDVWAGGAKGLLMHSADGGQTWARVAPSTKKASLTGEVISLQFTDANHGSVVTSTGEKWTTKDGGASWKK